MRYNLEFRKLTFYGLTRPQSIRKSKQISGQTILSSPQDAEFNPNFAKNRDIPVVENSLSRPVTPAVLRTDSLSTFYSTLITCQIPVYNLYYIFQYTYFIQKSHFVWIHAIDSVELPKSRLFERSRQDVDDQSPTKTNFKQVQWCVLLI